MFPSRGTGYFLHFVFVDFYAVFRYALGQYRIILSADTASEVRQLPERRLSRQAGIVRCCLREISTVLSIAGLIIVLIALAMLVLSDKKQEVVEE